MYNYLLVERAKQEYPVKYIKEDPEIMEQFGLEGSFKDPLVQPPATTRSSLLLDQVSDRKSVV